jgi:cytochrome c-type biogenesis protein
MGEVSWLAAFAAGFISFISPCVLPIVPGYLSFISGVSIDQMKEKKSASVRKVFISSLFFVMGFSIVFITLGASATAVSAFLKDYLGIITKIAGVLIIILGIHYIGIYKIKWLNYEKRFQVRSQKLSLLSAFAMGFAFAFGWTPCIGPILAGILAIAATQETVWRGIILLAFYSAGLALPFLIASLLFNLFVSFSSVIKKYFRVVEIVGGVLLLVVGILIFTNSLGYLSGLFSKWFPFLDSVG